LKSALGAEILSKEDQNGNSFAAQGTVILQNSTVKILSVRRLSTTSNTYNLQVKNHPEYVANGVVVHNCSSQALSVFRDQEWISIDPEPEKNQYEEDDDDNDFSGRKNPYDS
jgi:hypothetical protein